MNSIRVLPRVLRAAALLLIFALSPAFSASPANAAAFEGTLRIQVEDHADRALLRYYLEQPGLRLELKGMRPDTGLNSGSKVRARGTRLGNVLALDPSGTSNLTATAPAQLAYTTGVQNVAVIMVNFSDGAVQPMSAATMQDVVFGATSDFLRENSSGQTWLAGSVFGWYTLPISKASCDPNQIALLAEQAATAAGANLSAYSRKFYVFPKNACTWAGLAYIGGANTQAWFNGKFDVDNFAHEFGHNLGLMHSHGLDCNTSPLGDTCTPLTYGDAADVMGAIEGHYNGFQKERLGWLSGLGTVSASGRYTLAPYETGAGTRVLKIPRGVDSLGRQTWYYLEYRQPVGFDSILGGYGTLTRGVLVRTGTSDDSDSSYLIDMTPNSDISSGFVDLWDSALMAGKSYSEAASNVSVSVVSADASGAVLDVAIGGAGTCTRGTPAVSLSAVPSAAAGSPVAVTVTVANRDSSACAATAFNLASAVPAGWTAGFSSTSLSISAGASASSSFSLTSSSTAAAGIYDFSITASCSRGSACAGVASGKQTVLASSLTETVATSKAVYSRGELVGLGAQVLDNGSAVSGATITFTITRPNGSTKAITATTGSTGTASATYRLSKQKDPAGTYGVRAQASWGGRSVSASTSFQVQ